MAKDQVTNELNALITYYAESMNKIMEAAKDISTRAKGGILRAGKGELVEELARRLVMIAWNINLNQEIYRINIDKRKLPIQVREGYVANMKPEIRSYWQLKEKSIVYKFGTDLHVYIDKKFVLPIECKAYTENAMMKRILVDATLLKEVLGIDHYYLFQLESQLGGDYSSLNDVTYGSPSTHALSSHFDVHLEIITLLPGERKIDAPIHSDGHLKALPLKSLERAIDVFSQGLNKYCK